MFDKIYTARRTEHVPYTKEVHEYRAPTDKSIEILNEMQSKVVENVLGQIRLSGSTELTDLAAIFLINPQYLTSSMHYKFNLNGKEICGHIEDICGSHSIDDPDSVKNLTKMLIEDMSEKIASYYSEYIVKACLINKGETVKFDV